MKKRGSAFYVLLVVLLFVWGKVFYDIAESIPEEEAHLTALTDTSAQSLPGITASDLVFKDSLKDPFAVPQALFRTPKRIVSETALPEAPKPELPSISLTGIVDGTAMIKGPDDLVLFAGVGDDVFGVTITTISPENVKGRFLGQTITLKLDQN